MKGTTVDVEQESSTHSILSYSFHITRTLQPMNITDNLAKPTTPLGITLSTPSQCPPATRYTLPFRAEAYKALEVFTDWWRIKTTDPRVSIKGMRVPGPRSGRNREQE